MSAPRPPDAFGRQNFQQLEEQYFHRTSASKASRMLGNETGLHGKVVIGSDPAGMLVGVGLHLLSKLIPYRERRLTKLLRDHRDRAVTSAREIRARDAFDHLLSYYSLMEIACLIGYVSPDLGAHFRQKAKADLSEQAVRVYYEEHYPLLLPRFFRERVSGEKQRTIRVGPEELALFPLFLDINAKLEKDPNVETFLWFLDDGHWGDYNIESLIAVTRQPQEFLKRLASEQKQLERDRLDMAVDGLRTFLGFCREFDALLLSCTDFPQFQSALWHYHAYWFHHVRDKVGDRLGQMFTGFASWGNDMPRAAHAAEIDDLAETLEEAQQDIIELRSAIARLTSDGYDDALRTLD